MDLVVGIAYEADIRTAKEVLYSVAEEEEARLPEEEILVFVDELGDSSVNMGVRIWVKTEDYWSARWRLTENIKYALDSHNISIPYPSRLKCKIAHVQTCQAPVLLYLRVFYTQKKR